MTPQKIFSTCVRSKPENMVAVLLGISYDPAGVCMYIWYSYFSGRNVGEGGDMTVPRSEVCKY